MGKEEEELKFYKYNIRTGIPLRNQKGLSREEFDKLTIEEKDRYVPIRGWNS